MHGSMSAAGGNQASRLDRAAPAPPADPTVTWVSGATRNSPISGMGSAQRSDRERRRPSGDLVVAVPIVNSEYMRNANANVATGVLSSRLPLGAGGTTLATPPRRARAPRTAKCQPRGLGYTHDVRPGLEPACSRREADLLSAYGDPDPCGEKTPSEHRRSARSERRRKSDPVQLICGRSGIASAPKEAGIGIAS
jgi:hypothetical protein